MHGRRLRGFSGHCKRIGFEEFDVGRDCTWLRGFSGQLVRHIGPAVELVPATRFLKPVRSLRFRGFPGRSVRFGFEDSQAVAFNGFGPRVREACLRHLTTSRTRRTQMYLTMVALLHHVRTQPTARTSAIDRAKFARHVGPVRSRRVPWRRPTLAISLVGVGHGRSTQSARVPSPRCHADTSA